jgi:tetratricopeptide (TPR) repeat protein
MIRKRKPAKLGVSTRDDGSRGGKRWKPALLALGLFVVTMLVFWPARHFDFINFDDPDYVTANARVQAGLTWEGVRWAFTTNHASNWHPLTWLSHMLDGQVFGLSSGGHHLHSVLLHALNAGLVFGVLFRFTGNLWPSAVVAGLFAWHPLRVESVAWVAERKDVLSACFGLLCLLAYGAYARSIGGQAKQGHVGRRAGVWYGLALVFFALGLMSKPMLVTWPFVMLLLDFWPLRRFERSTLNPQPSTLPRLLVEKLPFFGLTAGACGMTILAQRAGGTILSIEAFSPGERIVNALVSYWRYIVKLCWPSGLAIYYPFEAQSWWLGVLAGAGLIAVSVGVVGARRLPFLATGWFWFLGMLVPVIGLLQVGTQAMADRYTYVPAIGLFIIVAFGFREIGARFQAGKVFVSVAGVLLLLGCVVATARQLAHWRNSETLFRHALSVTEGNYVAYNNLGTALEEQGRFNEAWECYAAALRLRPDHPDANQNWGRVLLANGRPAEAEVHFRRGLETLPKSAGAWLNLGSALLQQGKNAEAATVIQRAVTLDPHLPEARVGLGCLLAAQGKRDEAIAQFEIALKTHPDYTAALNNLGALLTEAGRTAEAVTFLQRAVQLDPDSAEGHYNLANAFAALEQYPQAEAQAAVPHLREAVRLRPDWVEALNQLAWLLATHRDAALRNGAEAQRLAARAVSLTGTNDARSLDTLAAAYAEAGRFGEAATAAQQAAALAETARQPEQAAQIRERLALYRSLKPYRE